MFDISIRLHRVAALLALVLTLALPSAAQVVANDAYLVNFFVTGSCGNPTIAENVFVINTGQTGTSISANHGTVCADIYVFDGNQEMLECCSCPLTANALLNSSLCFDLLTSPLTGIHPPQGVIKIVADAPSGACDATTISNPVNGGLRAWGLVASLLGTGSTVNKDPFQPAPLTAQEQAFLGQACSFVLYLGSGRGKCNCPTGL